MRVYVDSSALIKRVAIEAESTTLVATLDRYYADRDLLISSSLAWIEVIRALHARALSPFATATVHADAAMSGIAEHPISPEVVSLARRIRPPVLRSLDAIHLASALLVDADHMVTYDARLAAACTENSLVVTSPGRA
ncbi:type II toxin-antitoxin system VapC family toxin [Frankia sp. Cas4]|uniref:type II toxin-antitoxin system VapC family toxin n=1 Tax=Frankia sp. Cas4 TaxID=3073927 RepID=UPI002AD3ACE2|nr:type II toxin-antitoxin system VapC family toxin [Frankia sp. Cas4]